MLFLTHYSANLYLPLKRKQLLTLSRLGTTAKVTTKQFPRLPRAHSPLGIWLQFAPNCEWTIEKRGDWANLYPHSVSYTFPSLLPTPLPRLGAAGSVAGETHVPRVVLRWEAGEEVEVRERAWV